MRGRLEPGSRITFESSLFIRLVDTRKIFVCLQIWNRDHVSNICLGRSGGWRCAGSDQIPVATEHEVIETRICVGTIFIADRLNYKLRFDMS